MQVIEILPPLVEVRDMRAERLIFQSAIRWLYLISPAPLTQSELHDKRNQADMSFDEMKERPKMKMPLKGG